MQIGNYNFDNPVPLMNFNSVNQAAIYAILGKNFDGNFTLIYIGESSELGTRIDTSHHKYRAWLNNYSLANLFVSILWTPSKVCSKQQRFALESELINLYNPICNG